MKELDIAVDAGDKPFKLKALGGWRIRERERGVVRAVQEGAAGLGQALAALGSKITFVALSLDNDVKDGKAFHKKLKLAHMKLAYMPEEKSAVAASYGASTMPASFVIDPEGRRQVRPQGLRPAERRRRVQEDEGAAREADQVTRRRRPRITRGSSARRASCRGAASRTGCSGAAGHSIGGSGSEITSSSASPAQAVIRTGTLATHGRAPRM